MRERSLNFMTHLPLPNHFISLFCRTIDGPESTFAATSYCVLHGSYFIHERAYRIVLRGTGEMCMRRRSPPGPVYTNVHTGSYFTVREKCDYRIVLYSAGEMCMRRRSPPGLVYTNVNTGSYFIVREKCV